MYSFRKKQRLLNKQAYNAVFDQAARISNKNFVLLYRKNTLGYARLGLAISKKAVAKAHLRNCIKRLLRESFRTKKSLPAVDIVILAKANCKPSTSLKRDVQLRKSVDNLWDTLAAQCAD